MAPRVSLFNAKVNNENSVGLELQMLHSKRRWYVRTTLERTPNSALACHLKQNEKRAQTLSRSLASSNENLREVPPSLYETIFHTWKRPAAQIQDGMRKIRNSSKDWVLLEDILMWKGFQVDCFCCTTQQRHSRFGPSGEKVIWPVYFRNGHRHPGILLTRQSCLSSFRWQFQGRLPLFKCLGFSRSLETCFRSSATDKFLTELLLLVHEERMKTLCFDTAVECFASGSIKNGEVFCKVLEFEICNTNEMW